MAGFIITQRWTDKNEGCEGIARREGVMETSILGARKYEDERK